MDPRIGAGDPVFYVCESATDINYIQGGPKKGSCGSQKGSSVTDALRIIWFFKIA